MGMIWKIAFRNILKHRRRTFLSATTIAVGMLFFVSMDSLLRGMDRGAIDNMITLTTSAVKIRTPEYMRDQKALPLKHGVADFEGIRERLAENESVSGVAPRTRFLGQLSIYTEALPVMGTVIDPKADAAVFALRDHVEGYYFSDDSQREILLGKRLAQDLGLAVGDYVTLYALTRYESRNADDFLITGLVNTNDPAINQSSVYISYEAANDFLDLESLVSEVNIGVVRRVNLDDFYRDVAAVEGILRSAYPGLVHETYYQQAASFMEISKSKRAIALTFLFMLMLIAAVGIFNSVLMSVYERIREIGVMRAFGFRPQDLTRLFLLEGLLTGLLGACLGILLGMLGVTYLVVYGYPIDKIAGDAAAGLPVGGTIYGEWSAASFAFAAATATLIASIAGLIPAWKAGRMNITQTLRFT